MIKIENMMISGLMLSLVLALAEGSLKALSPPGLKFKYQDKGMRHSYANFGKIPYGTVLAGRNNTNACQKFTQQLDPEGDPDSDFSPIVLVDRGGCSFVRKSRNVQELGGAVALIANHQSRRNIENFIMIDDGTGSNIAISTLMISKEDGIQLKQAIKETELENHNTHTRARQYVVLVIEFWIDKPDDRVEYDIWYSSGDQRALTFIQGMYAFNQRLGKHALMTPHFEVNTCRWCSEEEKNVNCIFHNNQYFCAPHVLQSILTGKEILNLGLIEHCIYEQYKDDNNAEKWWNYMTNIQQCQAQKFGYPCLEQVATKAEIDFRQIQSCSKNISILKDEFKQFQRAGIRFNPAVVVNRHVYRGSLDPDNVFKTICAGFNVTPDVCMSDYDPISGKRIGSSGFISTKTVVVIVIVIILVNVLLIYCYRRYNKREMKEEMQLQISSMMSQYFALNSGNDSRSLPS